MGDYRDGHLISQVLLTYSKYLDVRQNTATSKIVWVPLHPFSLLQWSRLRISHLRMPFGFLRKAAMLGKPPTNRLANRSLSSPRKHIVCKQSSLPRRTTLPPLSGKSNA